MKLINHYIIFLVWTTFLYYCQSKMFGRRYGHQFGHHLEVLLTFLQFISNIIQLLSPPPCFRKKAISAKSMLN